MEVANLFNTSLDSGCEKKLLRVYFNLKYTQWLNQRKTVRDANSAVAMILLLKTHQKWFLCCYLPRSFKIVINIFVVLYLKADFTEICKEISFPSFFRKMLMSAFLLRFKANYFGKMHGYPSFSLWIAIALSKIYFFRVVLTWRKNLGTVLKAKMLS